MPFDTGLNHITAYMRTRATGLKKLARPVWFASTVTSLPALLELFDSSAENSEWSKLTATNMADTNLLIGVRNRIAWLCGCRSDLRRQLTASTANVSRNSVHMQRFAYGQARLNTKVLERLNQLQNVERKKPLTGTA